MTIKEFLQAGGQIDPTFQLIDKCKDSYTKDDTGDIPDDATSNDLVQHSFDHDRYADEQVFDEKNEYFTITAPDETHCTIKISQYPGKCKRVFTDGGAHSTIPTNKGNVTVLDNYGNITRIYNYEYPTGIDFDKYCDIYQKQNILGMTVA